MLRLLYYLRYRRLLRRLCMTQVCTVRRGSKRGLLLRTGVRVGRIPGGRGGRETTLIV